MAAAAMVEGGRLEDGYALLLEETELRLGPPGGDAEPVKSGGKRDFSQTVDLKLKLAASLSHGGDSDDWKAKNELLNQVENHEKAPANKALVVGWPPVRSFRKNIFSELQTRPRKKEEEEKLMGGAMLVKVSMDGAPYLRKVDLKNYKSYKDLSAALETMFRSFTSGNCSSNVKDFMKENKLNCSEYVPTYEDKDGDWMLVGDVPWEMFVVSCRRLRIVHCSEAVGLAPRTAEKHKSGAER